MKRTGFTNEQITGILAEHQAGEECADLCRKNGLSKGPFCNWTAAFGGTTVSEAKRLKALEDETAKLRRRWPNRPRICCGSCAAPLGRPSSARSHRDSYRAARRRRHQAEGLQQRPAAQARACRKDRRPLGLPAPDHRVFAGRAEPAEESGVHPYQGTFSWPVWITGGKSTKSVESSGFHCR